MSRRRAPGDGSLYKRGDGLWVGAVTVTTPDGKQHRRTVSSKRRGEAARRLEQLKADIEAGLVATTPKTTVGEWLDYWLENIHRPQVRPTTYRHYEQTIRLHIKPHIGARQLHRLTQEDVRTMHRAVQGKSTRAAQKAHQTLQRALDDAVREGLLVRNVAAMVHKPRHTKELIQPLDADGARHLINTAIDRGDPLATRWAAAFLTGARQAELLGLTWDRVDLEAGLIDLAWQLQYVQHTHGCGKADEIGAYPCGRQRPGWCPDRRRELPPGYEFRECYRSLAWTRPKTAAGTRIVPLAAPMLALLRAHRQMSADRPNPHNLVWRHPDGRPFGPRDDHRAWQEAARAAGFTDPLPPLHAARHTTATLLMEAGVPEQVRMQIMGQSSVDAHRGYVHVDHSLKHAAVAELGSLLSIDPGKSANSPKNAH